VTVLHTGLASLVWGWPCLSLRALRGVELLLFGSLAGFFAWLQVGLFRQPELYEAAAAARAFDVDVIRLMVLATTMRWCFLIVVYGVVIPKPWRRCGLVVGGVAALPLLPTPAAAYWFGRFCPDLAYGLRDMATLMATGAAVAVFGSYRFEVLQQQAFAAQQLGQYRLRERLGSGGLGEEFLAEHGLLRRACAIELIRPRESLIAAAQRRFEP